LTHRDNIEPFHFYSSIENSPSDLSAHSNSIKIIVNSTDLKNPERITLRYFLETPRLFNFALVI